MRAIVQLMEVLIKQVNPDLIMILILVVSIVAIAIFFERAIYFFGRCRVKGKVLLTEIQSLVRSDRLKDARNLCVKSNSPLANCLEAALWHYEQGLSNEEIQNAVDEIALRELPMVHRRIHYLGLLGNVSTLLGLLGTILGLIQCFAALSDAPPAEKGKLLASGIAIAMYTTAAGLVIGILCMVGYSMLSARANIIIESIDESAVRLLNFLFVQRSNR
ncbi:MAG: MotA/TolQ/ExbB proton channel family protein [bacterium]